jgi:hypothetical protein
MPTPEGLCTACGTDYCAEHRPKRMRKQKPEETGGGSRSPYLVTTAEVLADLQSAVDRFGGVRPAARAWGYDAGYLSRVLRRQRELPDALANRVGYWREIWWREHD